VGDPAVLAGSLIRFGSIQVWEPYPQLLVTVISLLKLSLSMMSVAK
jgi:hypothetical protein